MVVEVQQLLAVEWLETSQDTLSDTSNSDGTNDLALEIELVLGCSSNIPLTSLDLFVCGDEVADQDKDGHDDVLGDRDDVGAGDFCDGDAAIGGVRSVQVDVIGSNTSSDGKLELLSLCETFGGKVTWVEAAIVSTDLPIGQTTYGVVMIISASTSS